MEIHNVDQCSPEWFALRCGVPTASNFSKIVTSKGEYSKQAEKYVYQLAGEKASGIKCQGYQSKAMEIGVETEDEARRVYELSSGETVKQVGFCLADGYGCSPDGMIGDYGLVEIKCPLVQTQVKYLLDEKLPTEYIQQVQGQLLVTGREWCDFVSYFPGLKTLIVRVYSDLVFQEKLKEGLTEFNRELDLIVDKIKEKN